LLDAGKKWSGRSLVEKSWINLKAHFTRAHKTYRLTKNTAIGAGYNMVNAATTEFQQDTVKSIANLANAAATDKGMIETMTTTNATLTAQLASLVEQVRHLIPLPQRQQRPQMYQDQDRHRGCSKDVDEDVERERDEAKTCDRKMETTDGATAGA
jgi:hypothetical protein